MMLDNKNDFNIVTDNNYIENGYRNYFCVSYENKIHIIELHPTPLKLISFIN